MQKTAIKFWRLSFFVNFMFTLLLFYPIFKVLFSHPKFYGPALWLQRRWAAWLLLCAGIRLKKEFHAPLSLQEPAIWCSNHVSALDILLMYNIVPRTFHFVAKKEHASVPLFGIMFSKTHIPVQRESMTDSYKAMQRALSDLQKGINIVLFPEGTMNFEKDRLLPFKNGAFKLACDANVPIIPVFFPDNLDRLPYTYNVLYGGGGPGKTRAVIGKPIYPLAYDNNATAINKAVRDFMLCEMGKNK